ncbi:unnamed protein product [Lymnaea stagnalis]|uniref:Uncharacterized protein n=1 Tax=Lymnaea stagnalis TaxID=6523 RepID=A0AAV2HHE3_LYMST
MIPQEMEQVDRGKRKLIPKLQKWWEPLKRHIQPQSCYLWDLTSDLSLPAILDRSCNKSCEDEDELSAFYPDIFTKALDDEGLLKYSNPVTKIPVLSVCYGFLNSELLTLSLSYLDEKKYRESFQHLDEEKRESYTSLFSNQYSIQPLVDGLPESVWLECVEPTLAILKALNALKRRKSNLSVRKSTMLTVDSNAACHGDFESAPLIFNPFIHGHQLRLMRVQFLALEGVFNAQYGNNQDNPGDNREGGNPIRTVSNQRRRARQHRPYNIHQNFLNSNFRDRLRQANGSNLRGIEF